MTIAIAPTRIQHPVGIGTSQRFRIHFYTSASWAARSAPSTTNGFRAVVDDPSGSTYGYALTSSTLAAGKCYFDLTGSNHTTTGEAGFQVHRNGRLLGRFSFEFVPYL